MQRDRNVVVPYLGLRTATLEKVPSCTFGTSKVYRLKRKLLKGVLEAGKRVTL